MITLELVLAMVDVASGKLDFIALSQHLQQLAI